VDRGASPEVTIHHGWRIMVRFGWWIVASLGEAP
jgi:hypothetical protein